MKTIQLILISAAVFLWNGVLQAQGCSDAGVCTIHGSSVDSTTTQNPSFELGYTYAKGLVDVQYNNAFIATQLPFRKNTGLYSRITYNQASGNFGTLGRLGDLFVVGYKSQVLSSKRSIKYAGGIKIPLSTSNHKINDIALPLDYQASLGTVDILLSMEYSWNKLIVDGALQLPVWQANRNSYFDEFSASTDYPTTNLFERKPDALVRMSYLLRTKNSKWFFKPNVMAIYHLGNDTFEDVFGRRQTIENSEGLTINADIVTEYKINTSHLIRLNLASPLVVREIRPDGLTRAFVASISYQFTL